MKTPNIEELRQAQAERLDELQKYLDSCLENLKESTQAETRVFVSERANNLLAFMQACLEQSLDNLEQQLAKAETYQTPFIRKGWIERSYKNYEATQRFIESLLKGFEEEFQQYLM